MSSHPTSSRPFAPRAAFGFVLILEVRELQPGRDPAPDQAPRLVDDDQAPEPESPDRR